MKDVLNVVGWLAIVAGAGLIIWSFAAPAAPPFSDTVNFELMAAKLLYAVAGAASAVVGAVFVAAGALAPESETAPAASPAGKVGG